MSSNLMQKMAELEVQLAALTAERKAGRGAHVRQGNGSHGEAEELAEAIGKRLQRVEQNLREDFVGKFAGNFLLATETITKRLEAVETRAAKVESEQKALEVKLQNHQKVIGAKLDESNERQRKLMAEFVTLLDQYRAQNAETLKAQQAAAKECKEAVAATTKAATLCGTFAKDYEKTATTAKQNITDLVGRSADEWNNYVGKVRTALDNSMTPVMRRVKALTEAQLKRRAWMIGMGVMLGLGISSSLAWLTQPQRYERQEAANWRNFFTELTPEQYDKVTKLLTEIEAEQQKAAEAQNKK